MAAPLFQSSALHSAQIQRWLALLLGFVFAGWGAYLLASGGHRTIVISLAVLLGIIAIVGLQRNVWILVLMCWGMTGSTMILPVPISIREWSMLLAVVTYVAYLIVSHQRLRIPLTPLDLLVLANVGMVLLAYVRNPVGLRVLGSETYGARFYFGVFLAAAAWWVISRLPVAPKSVARFPYYFLVGTGGVAVLYGIAYFFPDMAARLPLLYATFDVTAYFSSGVQEWEVPRYQQLAWFGLTLMGILCARYLPRSLFSPFRARFYALMLGMACILASGFRSVFIFVLPCFGFGSLLRRGWREFALVGLVGGVLLGGLLAGQGRLYELPRPAQRALAFLPGKWSPVVAQEVQGSSEGRFEWWRRIIRDRLIDNWWIGDGWGIRQRDFMAFHLTDSTRTFDYFTMTGGYHSGPLTTIRVVGVTGLVLFYVLMVAAAVEAVRCVRLCRGSPLEFGAIYLAIFLLWKPIYFTLIFGAFDSDLPWMLLHLALLRVLQRMAQTVPAANQTVAASAMQDITPYPPPAGALPGSVS